MHVAEKLWKQTKIDQTLSFFPGILGEFLQKTTPKEILQAESFLPYIFWRWYFLRGKVNDASPYDILHWRRSIEHWPKDGQFFAQPRLIISKAKTLTETKKSNPQVQINITVDYIDFAEQPLLLDLHNLLSNKDMLYPYGESYQKQLRQLLTKIKDAGITAKTFKTNLLPIVTMYFEQQLFEWYKLDPFIQEVFSQKEWGLFWSLQLKQAGSKGLSTDDLLDIFVMKMRKQIPGYSMTTEELDRYETTYKGDKDPNENFMMQYAFWMNFVVHLLIPLSMYLHLIAPLYTDEPLFDLSVEELLSGNFKDPMPLYGPCTTISLTPFGEKWLPML
jgi:hypothetical protein